MRWFVAAGVLAMAVAAWLLGDPGPAGAQRGARVGQPAPEVTGGPWINSEPLSMGRVLAEISQGFWDRGGRRHVTAGERVLSVTVLRTAAGVPVWPR